MGAYFGTTEITNFDCLVPVNGIDITQVFFAANEIFTVWATYDGAPPAQYSANGSMLADYRIYGSAGGVGDVTANLFNPNAADVETGCYYNEGGTKIPNNFHNESGFIPVSPGEYTFSFRRNAGGSTFYVNFYDASKNFVSNLASVSGNTLSATVIIQDNGYVRFNFANYFIVNVMFKRGGISSYIPYGYAVPMSVSDGTTSTTTPIYIGNDPLGEDEYVDYGSGKIYRMSGGVLTPTDPPVQLPALPTVDGVTITDYAGQSAAPSKFYAKYRKEGY